ncbi:hypothetical protein SAMN06295998_12916 [Primorskyibacter flagellatus]|uniref:Uncharacterized protein n=1 Tax=Primorskyibacter flagellatus TaxID=1387277 RepID=A0A1W2EHE1_9RHOB|nr:hypothetical protein SAMN06295998_12916 [Primorskyibacter flagellatus]
MLLATDRDNDFVQMPFVVGAGAIAPDAIRNMPTKSIDTQPDGFPADNHAPLSQKVLDVSRAQRETVVRPNSVGNDFARVSETLEAMQTGRSSHAAKIVR